MTEYIEKQIPEAPHLRLQEAPSLNLIDIMKGGCDLKINVNKCPNGWSRIEEPVQHEPSPFGDSLMTQREYEKLKLHTGEMLTVNEGKIQTWNAKGQQSTEITDIMTGRKPIDFGTEFYNNGVSISSMVDGSTAVRFPSGAEVRVRDNRIESVSSADGKQHNFRR